ncbi:hypothetical protein HK100_009430 [Physocladia obscura]|uniref:Carboxylesterase type B domain-containing protein n=1 Tax=Physocladia obscura TaxID=109957 RepID=A0AAD5T620_9FUNG|nr:hypothetical protein HK100_009430 [Physocladia obscura]
MKIDCLVIVMLTAATVNVLGQSVTLDYGTFVGTTSSNVISFLGIPYAAAPIGDLRFKPPQPPSTLSGTTDATSFSNACIPDTGIGSGFSEDCLYLNVYAPSDASPSKTYPVVVWVYGGSFNSGSSSLPEYNGTNFINAMPSKAVVVTFNYRLAYFGFLASSDLKEEGSLNAGLLDQAAAFKWTRTYIDAFGGNSTRITAWGQSAGAHSISYHMTAVQSSPPLFDQAILESGATNIGTGTVEKFQNYYDTLAQNLGCGSTEILNCLRNASVKRLVNAATNLPSLYLPVVDGTYLVKSPFLLAVSGSGQNIPIIWMFNTNEGTLFTSSAGLTDRSSKTDFISFQTTQFFFINNTELTTVAALYPTSDYNSSGVYSAQFEATADSVGDALYKCPTHLSTVAAIKENPQTLIYRARFNIIPQINASPSDKSLGVYHGAEIPYTWNYASLLTSSDMKASQALISAYSSFIATGIPDTGVTGVAWPAFNEEQQDLVIDLEMTGVLETPSSDFIDKCEFWNASAHLYDLNSTLIYAAKDLTESRANKK